MPNTIHPSLTSARVSEAVERQHRSTDNPGFCLACGAQVDGVEPDAENYECEICEAHTVTGAELLYILYFA